MSAGIFIIRKDDARLEYGDASNPIIAKTQPLSENANVPDTVDFRRLLRSKVPEEKLPPNFAQAA